MPVPGGAAKASQVLPAPPPQQRRLFQEEDGSGLRFYLRPGVDKANLAPLILREGGHICHVQEPRAILLARAAEVPAGTAGNFISISYVTDCVARKERLPMEHYRLHSEPPRFAVGSKKVMGQKCAAEGSKAQSIFQIANEEFEDNEGDNETLNTCEDISPNPTKLKTSKEAPSSNPKVGLPELAPGASSAVLQSPLPEEEGPPGPSAMEVAMAVDDIKHFMGKFKMDLATVMQAFLKNSGEVEAVESCLYTGQRADGFPFWSRQDDLNLLKGEDDFRRQLVAKYGAENVTRRVAFRKN
ncbi:telomeric repeat-binding factor 2-interacting protein 1 isoform X2 [Varanus komodoensis]|uniref:telomeric repeat-binding factor 2-interacting protein 1 isoform X2 n=1 Tax=Varanus komodoensis TaxID=61221 RepID=UPI001CF7B5AB|nr:telomeric repeat-binding factor 2-interacting protein 1 isoform X2 [Varanus komodoensis]